LQVERLVPEARSAEEPNGRPGTRQPGVPAAQSAAGTPQITGGKKQSAAALFAPALAPAPGPGLAPGRTKLTS